MTNVTTNLFDPADDVPVDVDTPTTEIEVDGADLALPPEGEYDLVVQGADFSKKSKDGSLMIILAVESPDDPAVSGKSFLVASPKARWRFNATLKALGLTPPSRGEKVTFKLTDFVGKKLRGKVRYTEYRGEQQLSIDDLSAPPEGAGYRAFES